MSESETIGRPYWMVVVHYPITEGEPQGSTYPSDCYEQSGPYRSEQGARAAARQKTRALEPRAYAAVVCYPAGGSPYQVDPT